MSLISKLLKWWDLQIKIQQLEKSVKAWRKKKEKLNTDWASGVEEGGDVSDTGRNRVTAEVSHVYFYSAACLCGKESQLNTRYTSLVSYQQIESTVRGFPFSCSSPWWKTTENKACTTAECNYKTPNHKTQILKTYTAYITETVTTCIRP